MSRLWARFAGLFTNRTFMGMDKAGNQYFARIEQIDGITKEKKWVIFKGEHDPTTIPVEWICWLNGQRTRAPTPEEIAELEARRERVKLNVARVKKEEEKESQKGKARSIGKAAGPDLKSFIQQLRSEEGNEAKEASEEKAGTSDKTAGESQEQKEAPEHVTKQPESSEPSGSGQSFRPGMWQPPT